MEIDSDDYAAYVVLDGDEVLRVVLWAGAPLDHNERIALARSRGATDRPRCIVLDIEVATDESQLGRKVRGCDRCAAVRSSDCICSFFDCVNWESNPRSDCGGRLLHRGNTPVCETCYNRPEPA